MIIVSQDKTKIVNFDNVNMILVREGKIISFDNTFNAGTDDGDLLAKYKTEERAKEVLQEIQETYASSELLKIPSVVPERTISGLELIEAFIYKMPKE